MLLKYISLPNTFKSNMIKAKIMERVVPKRNRKVNLNVVLVIVVIIKIANKRKLSGFSKLVSAVWSNII